MMALVLSVMAASTAAGSMFIVSGSMSTKIGIALAWTIELADAMNVYGVTMTSSPGLNPDGLQRHQQRDRAVRNAYPMLRALILGELLLELLDLRPADAPPLAGADHIGNSRAVGLVPDRPARESRRAGLLPRH